MLADRPTFPIGVDEERWLSNTITVRERAMLWFVNTITDKPEWWRKVDDAEVVAKWRAELATFVETGGDPLQNGFSDAMFDFCLDELRDKAALYKQTATSGTEGGIVSVLDTAAAVFKADGRVPAPLVEALRAAAKVFEDVPEDARDWHPGSNEQVLDLVHPSLWPLVYGTSLQVAEDIRLADALSQIGAGEVIPVPTHVDLGLSDVPHLLWSEKFQWLPAEFSFGADGKAPAQVTSYINNAHPEEHKALYPVVAQLLDLSLPMLSAAYERVMSWADAANPVVVYKDRKRIQCDDSSRDCTTKEHCKDPCYSSPWDMPAALIPEGIEDRSDVYFDESERWYNETHPVKQPEPGPYLFGGVSSYQTEGPWFPTAARCPVGDITEEEGEAPHNAEEEDRKRREVTRTELYHLVDKDPKAAAAAFASLREAEAVDRAKLAAAAAAEPGKDHRLQVIVKLANIHLTPEKPRYGGGSWHFEGQLNEHICATALFYYDCDNVTESRLAFRTITDAEGYAEGEFQYEQNDHKPFEILYGMNPGMDDDTTSQPLGDVVTKEGRLLVFPNVLQHQVQPFELADKSRPGHRKIVALFLVDPQVRVPSTATVPPQQAHWRIWSELDSRLPPELSEMVYEHIQVPYRLDHAKKLRAELIEERKALDSSVEEMILEKGWNFCEH